MSMQVTDTISYINTSNSSMNTTNASTSNVNHLSKSSWWTRLTLLEKKLVAICSILGVIIVILLIVIIVLSSKLRSK